MKPIAFVIPWYGDDIRGGAEAECNHLAHCLSEKGISVEVLTTCVKEASADRGKNTLAPGTSYESGILVRRFKVRERNAERYNRANEKLYYNRPYSYEDELAYLEEDINSPDMYQYIRLNKRKYEYFIFMPYLYGLTYFGSMECPDNAVIIPCLHDESYAYMEHMKERMSKFKGMIFLSEPESQLANKLYYLENTKAAVLGAYVESGWEEHCNPEEFRKKYDVKDEFILYAGRKDAGKKADELIRYFIGYKKINSEAKVKLIMIGGGKLEIPEEYQSDIIDLGFVSTEDKHNAFAAASLLCNPSHFESFSIVIMESWLVKAPVLVSEHCKVTTNFCRKSNGGLYYDNFSVFCGCLDYLLGNKESAIQMGCNGYQYVTEHFVKDKIGGKYIEFFIDL